MLTDSPIGYWPLDEASGTVAYDRSGGGRNGSYTSDANGTSAPGGAPLAANASGSGKTDGGQIVLSNLPLPTAVGAKVTVDFWMYTPNTAGLDVTPFAFNSQHMWINSGNFGFNTGAGDMLGIPASAILGQPVHITLVFENPSSVADYQANHKMYINGVLQTLTQSAGTPNMFTMGTGATISGDPGVVTAPAYRMPAVTRFSDLAIYNGELSAAQIQNHYKAGLAYSAQVAQTPGLLGYWRMDETSGTTALDYSGNNRSGTYLNDSGGSVSLGGAAIVKGAKQAAVFNGGELNSPTLPLPTATSARVTVEFWMYVPSSPTPNYIPFGFGWNDLWIDGSLFGFNTGNGDRLGVGSSGLFDRPVHVVAVFNNPASVADYQTRKLYINGTLQTLSQTGTPVLNNLFTTASISGVQGWTTYRMANGSRISDVSIYNGELTAQQVLDHYNSGR